ncbi:hypothetical protein DFH09DRAFT_1081064 [Mycena vulgaris]|nr:hypothetical protein DFH09DRAFT_1081064 [Mycena vulgaris]
MYIIPLIAAAVPDSSQKLGPSSGALVCKHITPQFALLQHWGSNLENTHFRLLIPLTDNTPSLYLPFGELNGVHSALSSFDINFYKLVHADPAWALLSQAPVVSALPQMSKPVDESCMAEEIQIDIPLDLQRTSCLVTLETTWQTTMEQPKAQNAVEVTSVPDLKDQLSGIMVREIFEDISSRVDFSYLAWHCFYYSCYTEQGTTKDTHPNFVQKIGKKHVNFLQRTPLASKEIQQDPEGANLLAELMCLITIIVKHFLPEEYLEIKIYVTKLPLNK